MAHDLADLAVETTIAGLRARDFSAEERTRAALGRIERDDDELGAFLEVWCDEAIAAARAIDADPAARSLPLAGVPVALKDNICVRGHVASAGSRILDGWESPYDATVARRLRDAGAVLVGRTNMDEFAMGSSTENSGLSRTANPHDASRVPGGSSGGSAAAVAAGMIAAALGSDTGGSVRQPAAFCGVAGLKPTYGRVSRYGLIAFASSLDQIGPLARSVSDCGRVLSVIGGHDPCDSTSLDAPMDSLEVGTADATGLRIGIPAAWQDDEGLDPAVAEQFEATVGALRDAGATVEPVTLEHSRYAVATYYVIATAEASANLARYDGVRFGHRAENAGDIDELMRRSRSEGFGAEVKRRILLGTYVLSAGYHDAYYLRAQQVRTLIRRDFDAAFERGDAVLGPTTPGVAFRVGERTDDPLAMYLSDVFTVPANLAGLPAISVPVGTDADGLPIGMQLCGPPLGESRLLAIAGLVETLTA